MDDFLGEIRIFPYNFIPKGWLACNGQTLSIQQNAALFSLLGTQFGGDGRTTFNLPNLQARIPMGLGNNTSVGMSGGVSAVTLTTSELPPHNHSVTASSADADLVAPQQDSTLGKSTGSNQNIYKNTSANTYMSPESLTSTGGSMPHNNIQPTLPLAYCICSAGMYPQRP